MEIIFEPSTLIIAGGALALWLFLKLGALALGTRVFLYWRKEGKLLQTNPTHLSPTPGVFANRLRFQLCRLLVFLKVGKLTVLGRENLNPQERYLIVANHQIQHDAVTLPAALGTLPMRGLMSQTELTDFRAPLAALAGVIAVHQDSHKTASLRLSIRALTEEPNISLVVFPQGRLVREGALKREQLQDGVALVLKKVNQNGAAAKPVYLLPVCINYQFQSTGPQSLQERLLYGWKRRWFGITTYGAVVSIGKPVLPDSYEREAVTEIIFNSITAQCRLLENLDEASKTMEV
ncbi:MAG: 1-acyl-sn-glycerol-3-phosphate acyltransferase [Candidatus Melainabacteria bacterium]|nr:1-acyl-sn-glycerol-3-phosphate acyltransferase [Candidatus Melainabacteria bacterium]